MTELEFLDDTVKYYSEDVNRRCRNSEQCFYNPASVSKEGISKGCAIGRFMTKAQKEEADKEFDNTSVNHLPASLIPKKLAKFSMRFLEVIQSFHDNNNNWKNKEGLTAEGKREYKLIKDKIERNKYV